MVPAMLLMVAAVAMLSKNPDDALICCFPDPLPPTNLEVQTASTTTDSVKVTWSYDSTKSLCEKWKVEYKVKDTSDIKELTTDNVNKQGMTIPGLISGQTYTISVFGVTTGGIISEMSVDIDATVSKYPMNMLYGQVQLILVTLKYVLKVVNCHLECPCINRDAFN